jgi:hypothetical protein
VVITIGLLDVVDLLVVELIVHGTVVIMTAGLVVIERFVVELVMYGIVVEMLGLLVEVIRVVVEFFGHGTVLTMVVFIVVAFEVVGFTVHTLEVEEHATVTTTVLRYRLVIVNECVASPVADAQLEMEEVVDELAETGIGKDSPL